MSKAKTSIEIGDVRHFLTKNFSSQIKNLEFLKGGELSQAFSFECEKGDFVIKIRKTRTNALVQDPFQKELLAFRFIKSRDKTIPIPKIVIKGIFSNQNGNKLIYCIAEKTQGSFVVHFSPMKYKLIDVSLIEMLHKIHSVNISDTDGYGNWTSLRGTRFNSMQAYVLQDIERQKAYTDEGISTALFEKELYFQITKKIQELIQYCSGHRYLIHGDYGFDNVLADANCKITAVFDWEHSLFGDFVYDLAWLDFWCIRDENHYSKIYLRLFESDKNLDFNNYEERVLCFKLYIGIIATAFFSGTGQKNQYLEAKKRILELLQD